ncbi:DUF167 domain-containing protein [Desulfatitalea tepidiphila]|uniref:DUF167 domain-containing protein n=1 Tax=Desulfatitalea tepidiphila TaxID=1185843 RepID=UPI0006B4B4E1|nr:DUF167 domain-containing protein [Desulfatitalea tepidiphila]
MLEIQTGEQGITFWVTVQPRASKTGIIGLHDKALKIRLTAPPVDNAANKQCVEVLSKALGRPKSTIEIVAGQTSRQKQVRIRAKQGTLSTQEQSELKAKLTALAGDASQKTP